MPTIPNYKQLRYWLSSYAAGGCEDRQAIENFIECESQEALSSLRGELIAIKNENFSEEIMLQILGPNRVAKHGSFVEWAKVMLLLMARPRGG